MSKRFKFALTIMGFVFMSVAAAHPGHGHSGGDFSLMHYLSDPLHIVMGLFLVAAFTAVAWVRSALPRPRSDA